jgi:hypothetical protein
MTMKLLAATAALSLMTSAAFAATTTTNPANDELSGSQTEMSQTNLPMPGPVYRPNMPAKGLSPHVIGGETFYFGNDVGPGGGDGAA